MIFTYRACAKWAYSFDRTHFDLSVQIFSVDNQANACFNSELTSKYTDKNKTSESQWTQTQFHSF